MKGSGFIVQTLYDYLRTTQLWEELEGRLYKFKRPLVQKDSAQRQLMGVVSVIAGTTSTVQTFRCNVNIYVPSLLSNNIYYPDHSKMEEMEQLCVKLLKNKVIGDCLVKYADTPTFLECVDSNEWVVNSSLEVLYL